MKRQGFTLIELMIVIVVIGILAAIAYPSYTRYVDRAAIADGRSALLSAAQQMERCFTRNDTYVGCVTRTASEEGFFNIGDQTGVARTATTYSLAATAAGTRPATCRTMTLNQLGARGPAGCW
jgi:type IV pilus assembly protein PilE